MMNSMILPHHLQPASGAQLTSELQDLRKTFADDLFDHQLPFWSGPGADRERGGFLCWVTENGERVSDQKYMWYQGRGLWVFAHSCATFGDNPEWKEIAQKTYDFLLKHGRDANGCWRSEVGPAGEPVGACDEMGYAGVFVAEGMLEFARAGGGKPALASARDAFARSLSQFDDRSRAAQADYLEDETPPGVRLLGHEMVKIRFLSQLMDQTDTPEVRSALRTAIDHVFQDFVDSDHSVCVEALDFNYQRLRGWDRDLCVAGHGMETAWMILDAAARLGDTKRMDDAIDLFWRHHELSWDTEVGVYRTVLHLGDGPRGPQLSWHYDEAVVGFLLIYLLTGDRRAHDLALSVYGRAEALFLVRGSLHRVWARSAEEDGRVELPLHRIGNYHAPRRMMLGLEMLALLSPAG